MFNNGSITTQAYVNVKQILGNDHFIAVGAVIDNSAKNSEGVCLAGTPLTGDLLLRNGGNNAFTKATEGAKFVLLHDVVFDGNNDANATVLIHGTIQKSKCDSTVQSLLTSAIVTALASNGIYVI